MTNVRIQAPTGGEALAVVSATPHIRSSRSTRGIMLDVLLALLPALAASVWYFGSRALILALLSVVSCVAFEWVARRLMKRPQTVGDLSAAVTGLLLAFNLPATLPLWMAVLGAFVAIVVVKQLFGGIGQNFVNPAITARIVLTVSFATQMTAFHAPNRHSWGTDAVAQATPMKLLSAQAPGKFSAEGLPRLLDMFLGNRGGSLGEGCAAALLLGFAYLCARKVITPLIPLCFVGTVAAASFVAGGFSPLFLGYELLGGGLLLGACFMATDYATCPINWKGKVVFGIGCGLLTALIRLFGNMPEGVSFSILLMNLLVPHIEALTAPKPFGKEGKAHDKAKSRTR
ncbi:MAG: RnfABCDGE type electron transport complex subunit D [Oscillospiraceae bacterium]|jgi:electron transport complex protein RnfD|nr:RnfABCDGE type electron transport complex subunit D [Oscillospiraceae bacterium]